MKCDHCGSVSEEVVSGRFGIPAGQTWCMTCTLEGLMYRTLKETRQTDLRAAAKIRAKIDLARRYHGVPADVCPRCGNAGDELDFESYEVPGVKVCIACAHHEAELLYRNIPGYPKPWLQGGCWSGCQLDWDILDP